MSKTKSITMEEAEELFNVQTSLIFNGLKK